MAYEHHGARLERQPATAELTTKLLSLAGVEDDPMKFLEQALDLACEAAGGDYAAVARGAKGKWLTVAATGGERTLPVDLLYSVLDEDRASGESDWAAAPLVERSPEGELLVLHCSRRGAGSLLEAAASLAPVLGATLSGVRKNQRQRQRIERLEAILDIAAQWTQTLELDALLIRMAQASTRLLDAERASIFLWDKRNKTLVGRPALGVEGGELRVADDAGVVGQVVHTGEIRRVDADDGQSEINREVDKQLNFQTRTLLCAPLQGRTGELFGAFEMINKRAGNFTEEDEAALTELAAHAAIALENTQQYEQLLKVRNQMADQAAEGVQLIGQCPAIEALRSTIRRVADTELAVLILGENGVGKEVVAGRIHYLSRRRSHPFIAVNCAALTETLLESELFGHEKGAFTDAHETRAGKFELASGGTLFLDEIGDMSLGGQAKLLRVLEEKVVVRVGGSAPIHTDARVLAASNQNLASMVREKRFREDLFFRLNVVTLELPPLRERGDDVLLLAEHFLRNFCAQARRRPPQFTAAARKRLLGHVWPGNIRELRNLMERLAYLSQGDKIDAGELAFILSPEADESSLLSLELPLTSATRRFQVEYIRKQIERARGNMTSAAQRLGLHRSNLYRKMRQLGMDTQA